MAPLGKHPEDAVIDRAFFTIEAAAQQIKCSVADLVHLGGQGRLPLYANVEVASGSKHLALRGSAHPIRAKKPIRSQRPLSESDDQIRELQQQARQIEPLLTRLSAQTTPLGLYLVLPQDLRRAERPAPFPMEIKSACRFDGGLRVYFFEPSFKVDVGHLVLLPGDLTALAALMQPESVATRDFRWFGIWNEEIRIGPARGAQSRAIDRIVKAEGHTRSAVKAALLRAKRTHGRSNSHGSVFNTTVHRIKG